MRLRKKVGLHYIVFGHIKSNSKPNIDDFTSKILEIIFQQRNLGYVCSEGYEAGLAGECSGGVATWPVETQGWWKWAVARSLARLESA